MLSSVNDIAGRYPLVIDPLIVGCEQKLGPDVTGSGDRDDRFANSISLNSDTVVIGVSEDDTAGGSDAGSAYVFVRSGGVWTEEAKLEAGDAAADDLFGGSVSLYGDTALIGAYAVDTAVGADAGSAYVIVRRVGVWTAQV